jgi:hypothetical protein
MLMSSSLLFFCDSYAHGAQPRWLTISRSGFRLVLGCFGQRLIERSISIHVPFFDFKRFSLKKPSLLAACCRGPFPCWRWFIHLKFLETLFCLLGLIRSWYVSLFYALLYGLTRLYLCPPIFFLCVCVYI